MLRRIFTLVTLIAVMGAVTPGIAGSWDRGDDRAGHEQAVRESVCHVDRHGDHHAVRVRARALDRHVGHGDLRPGTTLPGADDDVLDRRCRPTAPVSPPSLQPAPIRREFGPAGGARGD